MVHNSLGVASSSEEKNRGPMEHQQSDSKTLITLPITNVTTADMDYKQQNETTNGESETMDIGHGSDTVELSNIGGSDDSSPEEKVAGSLELSPTVAPAAASFFTTSTDLSDDKRRRQLKQASERCRKRQKNESLQYTAQINKIQREITALKLKLSEPVSPTVDQARSVAKTRFEMKQRIEFIRKKLAEHTTWMQSMRSLIASAPLFSFAVAMGKKTATSQDQDLSPNIESLDEWREAATNEFFSKFIMEGHLKTAIASSTENASKLLDEFASPNCHFLMQVEVRGWKVATNGTNDLVAFRCDRVLPSIPSAHDVAMELWASVRRDDVLRTFAPIIQDSVVAYDGDRCSLSRRLLQLKLTDQQQAIVTVESLSTMPDGKEEMYQISIEAINDPYLCTFAAEKTSEISSNMSMPLSLARMAIAPEVEETLDTPNNFILAARVKKLDSDGKIHLKLVGCMRHEPQQSRDARFDLLQYFVNLLPVYEDLHLAQCVAI